MSDDDISRYMDFDSVLSRYEILQSIKRRWYAATAIGLAGIVLIVTIVFWPTKNSKLTSEIKTESSPEPETTVAVPATSNEDSVSTVKPDQVETTTPIQRESQTSKRKVTKPEVQEKRIVPSYSPAEPLDGYPALYKYFEQSLRYPELMLKDSIEGDVLVSFVIDSQGMPEQIVIENSLGASFDAEAIRLIQNMPRWKPAEMNGKPTRAKLSLPINFQLEKE